MPATGYGISALQKTQNILLAILIMNVISTSNFNQANARTSQDIPRPEHPRPQLLRAEWLNLNGEWQFAETNDRNDESFLQDGNFPDSINVPFCRESKLSGLERRGFMKNVWYKRTFDAPKDWKSPRIRLHFNACDWHTRVWLNGEYLGEHTGGNAPFWFDITDEIQDKENVVIVHAFDDSASALQPLGKQSIREESYAIFYTRTTGIWQTVWLEGVGETFIRNLRISPDPDSNRILVHAELDGPTEGLTLEAIAKADGKEAGKASVQAKDNNHLVLDLSVSHLWSPQDPFLYDLVLNVRRNGKTVDTLTSYFGLRSVSIEGGAYLINGKPVFQRLVLDQGFYPEGIWTAPTDEALKGDIELSMAAGFNGARLHQKVFEPRFLYWADKLGYLCWGEYPSYGPDYNRTEVDVPFIREWGELVQRDFNHPSIIGWCPFNETPDVAARVIDPVVRLTRLIDPDRPVIDTSGWVHTFTDPELLDAHDYDQNPETFKARWIDYFNNTLPKRYQNSGPRNIPFFISEFGGIGWFQNADNSWGYGNNPKTEDEFFTRLKGLVDGLLENPRLFGFCYTQLTDIEQEKNGVFYYDRRPKFDLKKFNAVFSAPAAYEKNPPLKIEVKDYKWDVLLGTEMDAPTATPWRYRFDAPPEGWEKPGFDDSGWKSGLAAFGEKGGWKDHVKTPWTGKDIWLRNEFEYDGGAFEKATLVTHYDNATDVYLNGELLWHGSRWNNIYAAFDITEKLPQMLKNGKNVIAVHCHQDEGGQYIDVGILLGK